MGSVVPLRNIDWKVTRIPLLRSEGDVDTLRRRCEQLFRIKGDRKMVVITKRGEILDGFGEVDQVLKLYRTQKALSMVCFVQKPIEVLTNMHIPMLQE